MNSNLDLIIVGGGIAGVNAAIYAKRSGLNFKIFEPKAVGGQLFYMEKIDNYVGLEPGTSGAILAERLSNTLSGLEIPIQKKEVKEISHEKNEFSVSTGRSQYQANAIIIATGASFKKLKIKNEDKFTGLGVSYCAVCDGFFFKNKDVAVAGGGNTAVEEALYLSNFAKSVTLIHRRNKLRALDYLQKNLKAKEKVKILYDHSVKELKGSQKLEGLILEDKQGKTKDLAVEGLFIAIGVSPNSGFCADLVSQDAQGFILTDEKMKTSHDSIWACGDCRQRPLRQLITAASEGAIASIEVYKQVRENYLSV